MAAEGERGCLAVGGYARIYFVENAGKFLNPALSGSGQILSRTAQGKLDSQIQGMVDHVVAQHLVALLKCPPIAYQMVKIYRVGLRDDHIHEAASLLAGAAYQLLVGRGNHHKRECSDMSAQALVFLSLALERLAFSRLHAECKLFVGASSRIQSPERREIDASARQRAVGHPREAFAEAQIVDCVEQVALSHTVVAQQTVDFR